MTDIVKAELTPEVVTRRVRLVTIRGVSGEFRFRNSILRKDLHEELMRRDVNLTNTKIMEGRTRVTLDLPTSVVPDGDIDLFLMQKRSKGGTPSKKPVKKPLKKVAKKVVKKVAKKIAKKAAPKRAAKVVPIVKKAAKKVVKKVVKSTSKKAEEQPIVAVRKTETELKTEIREISDQLSDVKPSWDY